MFHMWIVTSASNIAWVVEVAVVDRGKMDT